MRCHRTTGGCRSKPLSPETNKASWSARRLYWLRGPATNETDTRLRYRSDHGFGRQSPLPLPSSVRYSIDSFTVRYARQTRLGPKNRCLPRCANSRCPPSSSPVGSLSLLTGGFLHSGFRSRMAAVWRPERRADRTASSISTTTSQRMRLVLCHPQGADPTRHSVRRMIAHE